MHPLKGICPKTRTIQFSKCAAVETAQCCCFCKLGLVHLIVVGQPDIPSHQPPKACIERLLTGWKGISDVLQCVKKREYYHG